MNCACASAGKVSFTVQVRLKSPTPNIARFANVTKHSRNDEKNVLPSHKTINSNYYIALLNRLSTEMKKKWPHMKKKKVLFHQDNAPCQGKRFGSNEEAIAETEVYF